MSSYVESVAKGLVHVRGCAERGVDRQIGFLESGEGSRKGCLLTLGSPLESLALLAYFSESDIKSMKQWMSVTAKVRAMHIHEVLGEMLTEELLWPLVSDNEEIIDWYRQFDAQYWPDDQKVTGGDKTNPKNWMFYRYQSWLALNQRWGELADRCERILSVQEQIKKDRMYLVDHRFYLALARGNVAEMESVLMEMRQPRMLSMRHKQESGLTENFIAAHATIFAKMAWRNGYEVKVDTPWIPKEWLPVRPNPDYQEPWSFMKNFDLWQKFKEPWAVRSPKKNRLCEFPLWVNSDSRNRPRSGGNCEYKRALNGKGKRPAMGRLVCATG